MAACAYLLIPVAFVHRKGDGMFAAVGYAVIYHPVCVRRGRIVVNEQGYSLANEGGYLKLFDACG